MRHFGLLGPRTCGSCLLKDTLFWRVNTDKKIPLPIVVEGALTPEELVTWKRIKGEPESLLDAEEGGRDAALFGLMNDKEMYEKNLRKD